MLPKTARMALKGARALCAETGRRALKILGINESDGLGKQDLVIFLYAVGLVRAACACAESGHAGRIRRVMLKPAPTDQSLQNPTDDVIDSKLRAFKLHDLANYTFGHVCHIW